MVLPRIQTDQELLRYEIGEEEAMLEAITNAFQLLGLDVYEADSTISEWTKDCALEEINWNEPSSCRVTMTVWGHPTAITSEEVRIFE